MTFVLLDEQLRFVLKHCDATLRCWHCGLKGLTPHSAYYHLVDFHGRSPEEALAEPTYPAKQPS